MELIATEAKKLISSVGPSLGCGDFTDEPIFPDGRNDVAAVRRMAEDGHSYGYDTIYLVWKDEEGKIHHREIKNSRATKDYIHIRSVTADGDEISVNFGSGGSYSGSPWKDTKKISVN